MTVDAASIKSVLPARRGGAKALLLTILGEFVLPRGGAAWTTTLVTAASTLGINEKNARQALARIRDQGLIGSERHGRAVRWNLTESGQDLLKAGTSRIYDFGTSKTDWNGEWLVAHCPVAESQRTMRNQLRTQLGFLGFGELSASLLVSPHVNREPQLREVLEALQLEIECTVLRSSTLGEGDDAGLVAKAWDLAELSSLYESFIDAHATRAPATAEDSFGCVVELVHDWRRFPFVDPELPTELLPIPWAGNNAVAAFANHHSTWSPPANAWFEDLEQAASR